MRSGVERFWFWHGAISGFVAAMLLCIGLLALGLVLL